MRTKTQRIIGIVLVVLSAVVCILLGFSLPHMYFLGYSLGALFTLLCLGCLTIAMAGIFIFCGAVWSRRFVYFGAILGFVASLGLVVAVGALMLPWFIILVPLYTLPVFIVKKSRESHVA
jgi:hypothetical protein